MTIYQLHWQFEDGTTEMRSQKEIKDDLIKSEDRQTRMRRWIVETQANHPLPEGACWMMCNEEARGVFVKTYKWDEGT